MWLVEDKFHVVIGGNTYINVENIIEYKGEQLFTLKREENGYLGIYFVIYDATGKHVATVKRNEMYVGDKSQYVVEGSANRYALIEKPTGRLICEIKKRADAAPAELSVSVRLYTPDGFLVDATPTQTNLGGAILRGNTIMNCTTGIAIT